MVQAVDRWVQPDGALESTGSGVAEDGGDRSDSSPAATAAKASCPRRRAEPTKAAEAAEVAPSAVVPPPPAEAEAEDDDSEPVLDESRLKSSSMGNANLENILIGTFVHHILARGSSGCAKWRPRVMPPPSSSKPTRIKGHVRNHRR